MSQWWEHSPPTNVARFDSRTRCHMWVEFVVGSRPCSKDFSPGTLVFPSPQKPTFQNFNSIWTIVQQFIMSLWLGRWRKHSEPGHSSEVFEKPAPGAVRRYDVIWHIFILFSNQSPCDDSRHLQIWPNHKSCSRLPSFLVIGPPFGGLDVLAPLLKRHPDFLHIISTNNATVGTSFFNTENYMKGLDWWVKWSIFES